MIADVGFSTGRHYLQIAGVIVAMEGDQCYDKNLLRGHQYERFEQWDGELLKRVATTINEGKAAFEIRLADNKHFLYVNETILAVEGDKCRDGDIPEEILEPIPEEEMENATIGGKSIKDMDLKSIRFFRGDGWTRKMLQYTIDKISEEVKKLEPENQT